MAERILIIEDSKFVNMNLNKQLKRYDYLCESAYDFKTAELYLSSETFDYIILDLHLPDAYGIELVKTVKRQSKAKIIILTADEDVDLREELFRVGILDYFIKGKYLSISIQSIHATISNMKTNRNKTILIVEDSRFILNQVKNILEVHNYIVMLAQTAKDGDRILKNNKIDTIILDMILPDKHGLDFLSEIKLNKKFKNIPVLVLSGTNDKEVVRSSLKLGTEDFIHKPFNMEEFIIKTVKAVELNDKNIELKRSREKLESRLSDSELLSHKQASKLKHLAHHDELTSLPNRRFFHDIVHKLISFSQRTSSAFAILFLDIDKFKDINDSLGHSAGDQILIHITKIFKNSLREEDTISRFGGDEFAIVLNSIKSVDDVTAVAQKLLEISKEKIDIDFNHLYVSTSIGIAMYPQDSTDEKELIKFADLAMHKAKDKGRNNFQFYSYEMSKNVIERMNMKNSIHKAIEQEEFIVYFQPQYDARKEVILGFEALVRWEHPELGFILPDAFIPLAEESNLIIDIDKIVMKKAMIAFVQWYKNGLKPGILSLNLGIKQLNDEGFMNYFVDTMAEVGFKAKWLEMEITETQMMKNPVASIAKLNTLSSMGVNISIDDFGTGYSSLSYLKKLPIDKLKIDKSFVDELPGSEDDVAIIKAIIALADSLNLELIAEGVETKSQKDFLVKHKCDNIQGYIYSKPMSIKDTSNFLHKE